MRALRLGLATLAFASVLGLEGDAFAKGKGTPAAATDPSRTATRAAAARNSPAGADLYGRDTRTVGPIEYSHEAKTIGSWNSDPVVAERANAPGKFYDARTGSNRVNGTLNKDRAADATERAGYYKKSKSVTLASGEKELWKGAVTEGKAGEFDKTTGNGAQIEACALCTEGKISGTAGITSKGVQASGELSAGAYLAKVEGQAGAQYNGQYGSAGVGAKGSAYIGAEGKVQGNVEISRERLTANGKAEVFAGGKAEGEITGQVGLTNIGTATGKLKGEVSYGIGASAEGYFTVDWSTWTFKVGGKASATLGIGAGVGFETEVSIKPAVDWVVDNAGKAYDAVSSGVSSAASAIGDGAKSVAKKLCFWCKDDPAPATASIPPPQQIQVANQTPLNAPTGPSAMVPGPTGIQNNGNAGTASGAGKSGALGRD